MAGPRQALREKGGRRTNKELLSALAQWRAAKSGTKTVKTIETGFLNNDKVTGKLSPEKRARRSEIRAKIQAIKKTLRKSDNMPETDVAQRVKMRRSHLSPPTKPTRPVNEPSSTSFKPPIQKPNNNGFQSPPTKPMPQPGKVGTARQAALRNLRAKRK